MDEKTYRLFGRLSLLIAAIIFCLIAVFSSRPMKVSIFENVFIEVGPNEVGPPEFYEKIIELEDGRKIYLSDGSCKIREDQ